MARAVNYRRWQLEVVVPFVIGTVLEIGGGIGNFTPALARAANTVISIEPNEYCHRQLVENTRGACRMCLPNVSVYCSTIEDLNKHVPVERHVDVVLMMNVLEHIKDDVAVLARLKQQLKPTDRIVVLALRPFCARQKRSGRRVHFPPFRALPGLAAPRWGCTSDL